MAKSTATAKLLLGRDHEVDVLTTALDELATGRGAIALIVGEPGIGKTRLCDEVTRIASARGIATHWGRAWEAGGAPPYWLFVQLLRSVIRGLEPDALAVLLAPHEAELKELLPELRGRTPDAALAPIHPGRERFRLFDAVQMFVQGAAAIAPRVLVLDDLHAADPSSLSLLHFMVRDLRAAPLLLLGTYREAEARLAPDVGRVLVQIAREGVMLPLRRLDREEVVAYVAHVTGGTAAPERALALHRSSEGNPLFLREILRLPGVSARQPEGIREVLAARLSLLAPELRRVLDVAAILGREFELDRLSAMLALPEPEVEAALAAAADAAIVEPLELPTRWRFTHVLLRESLYGELAPDRRAVLHRAAAAVLRTSDDAQVLTELAHHLVFAIPAVTVAEAAEAAVAAARRSLAILAFEDASAVLERIAKLLENVVGEDRLRCEVLRCLGVAKIRAGEVRTGKASCLDAVEIARRLDDGECFARAVLGSACEYVPIIRDHALIALLEEACTRLPAGDGALRAQCMAQLAAERQPEPDTGPPMELAREAIAMARRIGDAETLRFALSCAGLTMLTFAAPEERIALQSEGLRLALAVGDKLVAARCHLLLMAAAWELGRVAEADSHMRAYEVVIRHRYRGYGWVVAGMRAMHAMWEGRFDDAEHHYREAETIGAEDQTKRADMVAFPVALCRVRERFEDLPEMAAFVRSRLALEGQGLASCIAEILIAQLYACAGDVSRTAAQLAVIRTRDEFAAMTEVSWLALLTEPCRLVGDTALAQRLYDVILPHGYRFFHLGPLGISSEPTFSRQLGLLAEMLGRKDEAVAHLSACEADAVRADLRSHVARIRYELAGALLARDHAGDRERARELLAQARVLATQLDQRGLLPLVEARAALVAGPAVASSTAPAPEPRASPIELVRHGEYWTVAWQGHTAQLRDSRGLQLLAQLVANPGREMHVLQLVGGDEPQDRGDAGPLLDSRAVQSYRDRLLDLREQLEECDAFGDVARAERTRAEIEALTNELARAVGLGGRERRAGVAAERARTTVKKRLRNAVDRIADAVPELGRHLDAAIRTGAFCGYLPEGRVRPRREL